MKPINAIKDDDGRVISFDIDREHWLRGKDESALYSKKFDAFCCLGFYSVACGKTLEACNGILFPSEILDDKSEWLWTGVAYPIEMQLADINDRRDLDDAAREALIKAEFAKHGVMVNFV